MNERTPRASVEVMAPTLPEPTPEALREALADPGFAPLAEALRAAVAGRPGVDVANDVMAMIEADGQSAPLGADLRAALSEPWDVDLADLVMGAIAGAELAAADPAEMEISAYFDGEIVAAERAGVARRMMRDPSARGQVAAYAQLAGDLREAVHAPSDVWSGVAHAIGADVEDEQGWAEVTAALRDAVTASPIDVSAAVMAGIEGRRVQLAPARRRALPRWAGVWAPVAAFAAAAAVVFSLMPSAIAPIPPLAPAPVAVAEAADFQLAKVNDAEVEDMEYAAGVMGGIIPPQADGEPLVIVVDDSALLAAADVPTGTHL